VSGLRPGEIVAQRFRVERAAGAGAMGAVYKAIDSATNTAVALKIFHGTGERDHERFEREARVLAELLHPNIVRYVGHGVHEETRWLAMEWLDGVTLHEHLKGRALDLDASLSTIATIADALGFAHRRGVVHRDLKPSNLYLPDGDLTRIKVLDFGIARTRAPSQLTRTGMLIGTPGYMAPEQARGAKDIDARADIFALGCVLFRCLTGRRPFIGNDAMAVLTRILLEEPPRVSMLREGLPREVDELVARMLSKSPAERPRDGAALVEEIRALGHYGPRSSARNIRVPESALGASERRTMCIVMARPAADGTPDLRDVAIRFGGNAEILADGSLLAVFTGGGAATDHAIRAVRCGLALRSTLPGGSIAVAAGRAEVTGGLHTGEVIDRGIALLAPGGGVVLDDVVARLIDARFEVIGNVVRGERDAGELLRTVLGKPIECVGRAREIGTVEALFNECVEESSARAVLLIGPAGIGKSRIRLEVVKRFATAAEMWPMRGDPVRGSSPFALIAGALRRIADLHDGEPAEIKWKKLVARVSRHVKQSELRRVSEFLGEIVGARSADRESSQLLAARADPSLMGDHMLRAWTDLVTAEAAARPIVFVIDDLQWSDPPSIRFLDAALRAARDRPLFLLAAGRPEVHESFPGLFRERGLQEVRVGELSKRACETIVRAVHGDAIEQTDVDALVEHAAGNAFYLEELLRGYAPGSRHALPETVLAMVQARLEMLPAEARRALRAASVFGSTFWRGSVVALTGDSDDASNISDHLSELVDRELIVPRTEARFPDEQEYRFRHALVRDAAYAMLTDEDRATGHRLAAHWLLAAGESDAGVLADHFEAGGEADTAIGFHRRAAAHALEANDFAAVIDRVEHGTRCGAEGEVLGALHTLAAEARKWRGELAEAESSALAAMELLPRGSGLWLRAAAQVAGCGAPLGHRDLVISVAEAVIAAHGGSSPWLQCAARVALPLMHAGVFDLADQLLTLASRSTATVDRYAIATTYRVQALRAQYAGDSGRALLCMREAVECFRGAGDLRNASVASVDVGFLSSETGLYEDAENVLRAARADAERLGLRTVEAFALNNLALPLAFQGKLEEAREVAEVSAQMFASQGDRRFEAGSWIYLARLLLLVPALETAEVAARRGVELADKAPTTHAHALAALAQVLLAKGKNEEALAIAEKANGILIELGAMDEGESLVRLTLVEALIANGDLESGRVALDVAHERLLKRAERIRDRDMHQSFLERVPENARILSLASR